MHEEPVYQGCELEADRLLVSRRSGIELPGRSVQGPLTDRDLTLLGLRFLIAVIEEQKSDFRGPGG